jgi:aspartate racemase
VVGVTLRTIGLIGGLDWETSAAYYRLVNERVRARAGGSRSAPLLLYSFDYEEVEPLQLSGRWDEAAALLVAAATRLERSGADLVVLCSNTLHRVAGEIEASIGVPFVHLADAVAAGVRARGLSRVGLLGSRTTMEQPFLAGRLRERGLTVLVPDDEERARVHAIIFDELVHHTVADASRAALGRIVEGLAAAGAEAIVVANFELVQAIDRPAVEALLSVQLHAEAAADAAFA